MLITKKLVKTEQLSMLGISRLLDIMILLELSTGATQCWKAFLFARTNQYLAFEMVIKYLGGS